MDTVHLLEFCSLMFSFSGDCNGKGSKDRTVTFTLFECKCNSFYVQITFHHFPSKCRIHFYNFLKSSLTRDFAGFLAQEEGWEGGRIECSRLIDWKLLKETEQRLKDTVFSRFNA